MAVYRAAATAEPAFQIRTKSEHKLIDNNESLSCNNGRECALALQHGICEAQRGEWTGPAQLYWPGLSGLMHDHVDDRVVRARHGAT